MNRGTKLCATLIAGWTALVTGCGPEPTDGVGFIEDLNDTVGDISDLPTPAIRATPIGGELPVTTTFSIAAPDGTQDFGGELLWDFDDGATATGFVATHTFTEPGLYSITVGNNGVLSNPFAFPVIPDLEIELDPNIAEAQVPWTVGFRAVSVDPAFDLPEGAYDWRLNGAVISNDTEDTLTLRETGTYTLGLFVTIAGVTIPCAEQTLIARGPNGSVNGLVAEAGPPQTVSPATLVFLDGSQSEDLNNPDAALSFEWTQLSGPPVDLVSTGGPRASFRAPVSGTLEFNLSVSNGLNKADDTVTVNVTSGSEAPELLVTNNAGLLSSGVMGGPFLPSNISYTLTNIGDMPLQWRGASDDEWITLSQTSGTLAGGASQNVNVTINASANLLDTGFYSDTITFINLNNGQGDTNRQIGLTVMAPPNPLEVAPEIELVASGDIGGPYSPDTFEYLVSNTGDQPLDWSATRNATWLTLSRASGTLAPGDSETVVATMNNNVNLLPIGTHSNEITFLNETEGTALARTVSLTVSAPAGVLGVSPAGNFTSTGPQGGPFDPSVHTYTLTNTGGSEVKWQVNRANLWVVLSPPSGTLQAGESVNVNAVIGVIATILQPGTHVETLEFVNITNGNGDTTRDITLEIAAPAAELQVSPTGGLDASGNVGGPFAPDSRSFTLTNNGGQPLTWQADNLQNWVSLSATDGTLAPGASTTVTADLNANANALSAGVHNDTISFLNMTSGAGSTSRPVTLTISEPAALSVTPTSGLTSSGDPGGPFDPDSAAYTLTNTGGTALTYQVSKTQSWVSLSQTTGTLNPGASTTVTVSINGNANALGSNSYSDTVVIANLTNSVGDTARAVNLTVNDPPGMLGVAPGSGLNSSGEVGGPFNPVARQYTLTNSGGITLNWDATANDNWITVTPSSGTLAPGANALVTVAINSNADSFAAGTYNGSVDFTNNMEGGTATRNVTLTVQNPAALAVAPSGDLNSSGIEGGPFSPSSRTYTLSNTGDLPLNFTASKTANWVALSQSSGTIAAGTSTTVVVSLNANADSLTPGDYNDTVTFTNTTNGTGNTSSAVNLSVVAAADMSVSTGPFNSSGSEGGPFTPNSRIYTITNTGEATLAWSASKGQSWVSLSQTSGTLAGGASTTVTVTLNANAFALSAGTHNDTVTFTNATNGDGSTARVVTLNVLAAAELSVTPGSNFAASGPEGGPFSPTSQTYTLTNTGDETLDWSVSDNRIWMNASTASGTLAAGASTNVTINLTSSANSLTPDNYVGTITFTNNTNGAGNTTRTASLTVTGDCETSSGAFTSYAVTSQSGLFSAEFDITPSAGNVDALTMFSNGTVSGYSDMAAAVRFNTSGQIDVRDGGAYAADQTVSYTGGATYHVRMSINVLTRTYSVYVTPPSGSEQIVAVDYDFRTEQNGINAIDHWATQAGAGSHDVCNMTITAGANQSPAVSAGPDQSTAMPNAQVNLDGTVSDDGLPNPPSSVTVTWSKVSGPGTVTFGSTSSVDTTADFSSDGTYVLRLTASDSELSASDEVTVTVAPPPPAALELSTGGLNFGGSTNSLTFTARNSGSGTLNYTITDNASWLTLSPTSGSSTGEADTITATVNRSGLGDGSYNATITVDPSTGSNQTISVSMLVGSTAATMTSASRSSGLAPLYVFFDTVGAGSGVVQPDLVGGRREYADLLYDWDFGDGSSGNWSTNGKSRNTATGYCAAHIYETPGTYTATLTVTNPATMETSIYTQQITVDAFSGATYYVSTSGSDSNNGTSPATPFQSIGRAMSEAGPNTRILFKRGDTWSGGGIQISVAGPGIIGAYANADGSDDQGQPKPKIRVTSNGTHGVRILTAGQDWRIMDLELEGPDGGSAGDGIRGDGTLVRATMLRLTLRDFYVGLLWSYWATAHTENVFAECDVHGMFHNGAYYGGSKTAALGNTVNGPEREHVLRIWYMDRGVYSHNWLGSAPRHQIKLHNDRFANAPTDSRYNVFTDNEFVGGSAWSVTIGPQDEFSNEIVTDTLLDRNVFRSINNQVQIACVIWTRYSTVRNNLFFADGSAPWYEGVAIKQRASEGSPTGNRVFNNTAYRGGGSSEFRFCRVGGSAVNSIVRNNFVSANSSFKLLVDNAGSGTQQSNNIMTDSPGFVNAGNGDLRLTAGSVAVDAGTDVGVIRDFDENDRMNQGTAIDVGAFEYRP